MTSGVRAVDGHTSILPVGTHMHLMQVSVCASASSHPNKGFLSPHVLLAQSKPSENGSGITAFSFYNDYYYCWFWCYNPVGTGIRNLNFEKAQFLAQINEQQVLVCECIPNLKPQMVLEVFIWAWDHTLPF